MKKTLWAILFAMALAACAEDDSEPTAGCGDYMEACCSDNVCHQEGTTCSSGTCVFE